jgi:Tfp pilus assembly protein PilZ
MAAPNLGMPRQGILPLTIKDKTALYNAYMPFVRGGGLFVPTAKRYSVGDEVFILLTLMDEKDRLPVPGKVVFQRWRSGAHEDRIHPRGHPGIGTANLHDVTAAAASYTFRKCKNATSAPTASAAARASRRSQPTSWSGSAAPPGACSRTTKARRC